MRIAILNDELANLQILIEVFNTYKFPDNSTPFVKSFSNSPDMLRTLKKETFDLIIVDWQTTENNGLKTLQWINEHLKPAPPVIMMISRICEHRMAEAFKAGAVECINKPLHSGEVARLNNQLSQRYQDKLRTTETLTFGNIQFDLQELRVTVDDIPAELTLREYNLALLMFGNLRRPLSRGYLYEHLWAWGETLNSRTLDTHIYRVRRKLKLTPKFGWALSTVYGYGYRLDRLNTTI